MNARKVQSAQRLAIQLSLLLLLLLGLGALVGSDGFAWSQVQADAGLIADIRLPRTLGACLAGALLGLAGALAQGLFRNPLADPYLLGSASGASLGVALGMVMLMQLILQLARRHGKLCIGVELRARGPGGWAERQTGEEAGESAEHVSTMDDDCRISGDLP